MNTKEMTREQISALADGELRDHEADPALAALRQPEAHADWEIYHQIGDVLRSDDMAIRMSPGFSARMSALLENEPAIVAPAVPAANASRRLAEVAGMKRPFRRWALPGMVAAAAAAAVAFVATPQLMVAMKGEPAVAGGAMVATVAEPAVKTVSATADQTPVVAATMPEGVVLRDPRIDDYLLAHQRFSPSVYSTAQYARSATFATDPGK